MISIQCNKPEKKDKDKQEEEGQKMSDNESKKSINQIIREGYESLPKGGSATDNILKAESETTNSINNYSPNPYEYQTIPEHQCIHDQLMERQKKIFVFTATKY
ncbi:hypothetical protein PPL_07751 [Heterostelium album PN500]|uniref:Uncharacterized protein n=1 Tax=Heterostelium pallidum (strain ATCC 26659 / Pp 5 / PN500) TaxID=670386 RepID=D3BGU9_HETP5|nr:hypothetical protein PPL_07751 [Heterostelium album PN500]EFA79333.1 hypothetical protein PPL_07751 [Heterostelium album PN500]|eukprot:XP_020431454.1 hypothetical protein PPL_07751 [Heterostelium album PN500]